MTTLEYPNLPKDEYLNLSSQGLAHLASRYDPQQPARHIMWTTDITIELPIKMKKEGFGI